MENGEETREETRGVDAVCFMPLAFSLLAAVACLLLNVWLVLYVLYASCTQNAALYLRICPSRFPCAFSPTPTPTSLCVSVVSSLRFTSSSLCVSTPFFSVCFCTLCASPCFSHSLAHHQALLRSTRLSECSCLSPHFPSWLCERRGQQNMSQM